MQLRHLRVPKRPAYLPVRCQIPWGVLQPLHLREEDDHRGEAEEDERRLQQKTGQRSPEEPRHLDRGVRDPLAAAAAATRVHRVTVLNRGGAKLNGFTAAAATGIASL